MRMNRRVALGRSIALAGASALPFMPRGVSAAATPVAGARVGVACDPYAHLKPASSFTVTSADVAEGEMFQKAQMSGIAGAGGEDRSPQLAWSGFPDGTQSFVVTMFDPDAPTPSGFWHWAVTDVPASTTSLAAGAGAPGGPDLPSGAFQLPNDLRLARYLGVAPPPGDPPHRYYLVVTALDLPSSKVKPDSTPALLYASIAGHTLARAILVAMAAPAG